MGRSRPQASSTPADGDGYELFAELYPRLRRFAAVVADADVEPDDLVQEALAAALRRHRLTDLDQPLAYLRRAIVNTAANHRRRAGRLRRLLPRLVDDVATIDAYPSDVSFLAGLDPVDRAVLYLADCERQPHAVIAEHLGLSPGAIRKRVSRTRAHLREELTATPEEVSP